MSKLSTWSPFIPYITVSFGMLVLHNAWVAMLAYHICMVAMLVWQRRLISFGNFPGKYSLLALAALIGASGGLILYLLWPLLGVQDDISGYLHGIGLSKHSWPLFIAWFVLFNAFLEEFYWRSYLVQNKRIITLNDLFYSGYHLIVLANAVGIVWLVTIFIVLTITALIWRLTNRWYGSICPSLICHIAADASIIFTIYRITTH